MSPASLTRRLLAGAAAVTALAAMQLARLLASEAGLARADAVIWATLAGFPEFAMLAMTAFAVRNGKPRPAMAALHRWTGLLVCWLLLVFAPGTAACYRDEISQWLRPELAALKLAATSAADGVNVAQRVLRQRGADAKRWGIVLPDGLTHVTLVHRGAKGTALLDPATGTVLPAVRDTLGGDSSRLHFDLHYVPKNWGRWIVGALR